MPGGDQRGRKSRRTLPHGVPMTRPAATTAHGPGARQGAQRATQSGVGKPCSLSLPDALGPLSPGVTSLLWMMTRAREPAPAPLAAFTGERQSSPTTNGEARPGHRAAAGCPRQRCGGGAVGPAAGAPSSLRGTRRRPPQPVTGKCLVSLHRAGHPEAPGARVPGGPAATPRARAFLCSRFAAGSGPAPGRRCPRCWWRRSSRGCLPSCILSGRRGTAPCILTGCSHVARHSRTPG